MAVLLEEGESAADIGDVSAAAAPSAEAASVPSASADAGPAAPQAEAAPGAPASVAPQAAAGGRVFASPLARRIASDKGIDLNQVKGSGPKGRIVKADVEGFTPVAAAPQAAAAQAPSVPAGPAAETVMKMYADREYEEVKLDGMRKTIAARLSEAKSTIPHFYLRRNIELDALLALRKTMNGRLADQGVKLSVNDFVIKACAAALQRVPDANAVWAGDRILALQPSDVAVAVAIDGGLITPVIRDAHAKGLGQISNEMKDLASRARDRKLMPHEYQGGSFSISNLGMFGIDNFDAVINPPHGSILAVGAGAQKPVRKGR